MTKFIHLLSTLFFLTSIAHSSSVANENIEHGDTLRLYKLDPIVVTADKIEVSRSSVTASVSVLSMEELGITREESIFSSIHTRIPGVFVRQRSIQGYGVGPGSGGQIQIRGMGGMPNSRILVMIDGRPQFMGIFGHPIPDAYLHSQADRVEVIRGPASVLYGTNAMGGVVNIITRTLREDGLAAQFNGTYGTQNTVNYNTGFGYKGNSYDVYGSYTLNSTNGNRPNSDFTMHSGFVKSGMQLHDRVRLTIDVALTQFEAYDPGPLSDPKTNNWVDITRLNIGFSIENKFKHSAGALRFFFSFGEHEIYDGFNSNDHNFTLQFYQTFSPVNRNMLTAGIDYKNYGGKAKNTISGIDFGRHSHNEFGIYIFSRQEIGNRLFITGGVRIENNNAIESEFIPQMGIAYRVDYRTTIRGSISKGFRSPTIQELYMFPTSNPDLAPERVWSYDIGVMHRFRNHISIEAVVFQLEGSNMIRTEGIPPNIRFENTGSVLHRGIEFTGQFPFTEYVLLNTAYTYMDTGNNTMSNPQHILFAGLQMRYRFLDIRLDVQHISKLYGANNRQLRLPDYTLLNVRFNVNTSDNVSLFFTIENIFNESYQIINDYPLSGRLLFTGARITL